MASTLTMITPDPEADVRRRQGLRRMRSLAVGLLLLAAVVYVVTLVVEGGQDGFWGFVNAGAEASMVGAIADWFAVTALFKHPLGLPIPHTALIPKRKDELGRSLEEFVGENFLQEAIIRERVSSATISLRVGRWLAVPEHARRAVDEVAEVVGDALGRIREDHVEELVRDVLVPRFHAEPISPLIGSLLEETVRDDLHHGLVDLALDELHGWLVANPEVVAEILGERAPWWAPTRLNDAVITRLHRELVAWVDDIRDEPRHHARVALDSMLAKLADDLLHDPDTQQRTERLKARLLDQPQVVASGVSLWNALRSSLQASLADADGPLRTRLVAETTAFAERVVADPALRARFDGLAADAAVYAVERYGSEVTAIITATVDRWDGKEASRRIELQVGRDLQFIRINGTIVGGLVGVLIHTVSVLIS
ncbi:DUF445 domain-containing protein [Nocardioides conyzicola]|uniref:DUF445 domain-containing protein n=1 Tax=Nocardioides conyzicola TaxID=1651781 RepID=A0ABP8WYD9_9ACTN